VSRHVEARRPARVSSLVELRVSSVAFASRACRPAISKLCCRSAVFISAQANNHRYWGNRACSYALAARFSRCPQCPRALAKHAPVPQSLKRGLDTVRQNPVTLYIPAQLDARVPCRHYRTMDEVSQKRPRHNAAPASATMLCSSSGTCFLLAAVQ